MALSGYAGVFALNTATGNQSVTGVGFQPDVVIFLPTNLTADGVGSDAYLNIGAAVSSSARKTFSSTSEDGQATTDTSRESYDLCISQNNPGSSSSDYLADFVSLDADGFTINITDAPGSI